MRVIRAMYAVAASLVPRELTGVHLLMVDIHVSDREMGIVIVVTRTLITLLTVELLHVSKREERCEIIHLLQNIKI